MRRGVVQTMSIVTLAVVGLSLRVGGQPAGSATAQSIGSPNAEPRHVGVRPAAPRTTTRQPAGKPAPKPSTAPTSRPAPAAAVSLRGDLVDTEYGPVRVQITVKKGRITEARAIARPQGDSTTEQINGYAVPVLNQEVVAAQGAHIDTVSGATYTSEGYRQSLQSALDAAHQAGAL